MQKTKTHGNFRTFALSEKFLDYFFYEKLNQLATNLGDRAAFFFAKPAFLRPSIAAFMGS